MNTINRVILTGRLVSDPEVRYTAQEIPVAHFRLAIKNNASLIDVINCVAWRGLAKICGQYLKKGRLVALEGKLQIRNWTSRGKTKSVTEIIVDNLQMLDNKFYKQTEKEAKG